MARLCKIFKAMKTAHAMDSNILKRAAVICLNFTLDDYLIYILPRIHDIQDGEVSHRCGELRCSDLIGHQLFVRTVCLFAVCQRWQLLVTGHQTCRKVGSATSCCDVWLVKREILDIPSVTNTRGGFVLACSLCWYSSNERPSPHSVVCSAYF